MNQIIELIEWLEKEKWYPMIKPTNAELEASKLLNAIIEDMQHRLNDKLIGIK